jgi:uncharacterized lipoprotein YehR (DUF1307 family)
MKKFLSVILVLTLLFGLVGCEKDESTGDTSSKDNGSESSDSTDS